MGALRDADVRFCLRAGGVSLGEGSLGLLESCTCIGQGCAQLVALGSQRRRSRCQGDLQRGPLTKEAGRVKE